MRELVAPVVAQQRVDLMLSTPLVHTTIFAEAVDVSTAVVSRNEIVLLDGPAGTGKTTAARYVAQQCRRPCAVVTIPDRPAPLDLLRLVHLGVTGVEHHGSRYEMTNDLVRVLAQWAGVLVIDEMHLCGVVGLQTLVHLYEQTERGFAVVIVGSGVGGVVDRYPNLATRVLATVDFAPLQGDALLDAVRAMDPRLAQTPEHVLRRHNDKACQGLLRRWVKTITWLDILGAEGPLDTAALDQVAALLRKASR